MRTVSRARHAIGASWLLAGLSGIATLTGGAVGPVATVSAQESSAAVEAAAKVLKLNREALELFEELEFELARRTLMEALSVIESTGLAQHSVAARTNGNLGVLYATGFKDEASAVRYFAAALAIKADFNLPKAQNTPETRRALEAARSGKPVASAEEVTSTAHAEALAEAPEPVNARAKGAQALRCPTTGEVLAGDDITLRCVTPPELQPAQVVMFYKRNGADDFDMVPMQARVTRSNKSTWTAQIPGDHVAGKWLPFYFEARNADGESLALSGRYDSPNLIAVKGGDGSGADSGVRARARDEDDENPLARKHGGDEDESSGEHAGRWFVGLGVGSGFGYAGGEGVEAYRQYATSFTPGMAGQGLAHALPEIGYFFTDNVALSVVGRIQYFPRPNQYAANGAMSALARLLFFAGGGPARLYGSLAAGAGEGFRLLVDASTTQGTVQDTVRGGPVLAGVGGGFAYDFGETFTWMLETNVLTGFPDFSVAFDFNTGLRANF